MVKRILLTLVQFIAFIALLAVGGNWDFINLNMEMRQLQQGVTPHVILPTIKAPLGAHTLIANGLIFAGVLYLLILLFEVIRKRLHPWAALTTLALVLAICLGFAMKMGLPPAS